MNQEMIGKFIKNLRIKEGLTQEAFANMFGVTYQAVSKWENGKNIPDISILKAISKKFNVPIDDLLEGVNTKKKKKILGIVLLVVGIALLGAVIFLILSHNNFEFKTINTTCSDFKISGSAAYDSEHTSIYISDINYCGKEDNTVYSSIECTLYEKYDNNNVLVSSYKEMKDIKLNDYLEDVKLSVDNYNAACKRFKSSSLLLVIKANDNGKSVVYDVPLTLEENC